MSGGGRAWGRGSNWVVVSVALNGNTFLRRSDDGTSSNEAVPRGIESARITSDSGSTLLPSQTFLPFLQEERTVMFSSPICMH